MEIKPPQAGRSEHRYKEKKTSRDKKHSRNERRHKERDRLRDREFPVDRRHGHRIERTDRNRQHSRVQQQSPDQRYEAHPREREHYRPMHKDVREMEKRPKEYDRRKDTADKSEAERELEDLRSRLLIKRNKYADAEKRIIEEHTEIEYRSEHREIYRYEHHSGKREKEVSRKEYKHKSRKSVIEVIDSPDENADMDQSSKYAEEKHRQTEDPELIARRARLLEAEREMAKRKESAREELEARRELRREQKETNPTQSVSPVLKKRRMSDDSESDTKKLKDDEPVDISDNSDDTVSDTDTNSNTDDSDEQDNSEEEEELVASPLSVGDLSKSDRRRRNSSHRKSHSRSISRSHTKSRSRSKTPASRTPSRSPRIRNRSRSSTPTSDFEKDKNPDQPVEKVEEIPPVEEVKIQLPNYFPGIQGCRSVEEFQCLNRIEEGTYGVVYRARDKRTEEIVALKRLKMEKEKEGFPITALREINTLLKGQHPNIVTVREIVVGSNMDKIFIVMDYVEHDLKSLMETMKHRKQVFLPAEVKCLTQQLLRAVGHLHDNWILHRDLKTSNLLLSHKGILKVSQLRNFFTIFFYIKFNSRSVTLVSPVSTVRR